MLLFNFCFQCFLKFAFMHLNSNCLIRQCKIIFAISVEDTKIWRQMDRIGTFKAVKQETGKPGRQVSQAGSSCCRIVIESYDYSTMLEAPQHQTTNSSLSYTHKTWHHWLKSSFSLTQPLKFLQACLSFVYVCSVCVCVCVGFAWNFKNKEMSS